MKAHRRIFTNGQHCDPFVKIRRINKMPRRGHHQTKKRRTSKKQKTLKKNAAVKKGGAPPVCVVHRERIAGNEDYKAIQENIIGDNLMGKVRIVDTVLAVTNHPYTNNLIEKWYEMSAAIRAGLDHGEPFHVYRGIKLPQRPGNCIIQPIPFSTGCEIGPAIGFTDRGNYLLDITVTPEVAYTCITNPEEGDEVILPAGVCVVTGIVQQNIGGDDGIAPEYADSYDFLRVTVVQCTFRPANTIAKMRELHEFYHIQSNWNDVAHVVPLWNP